MKDHGAQCAPLGDAVAVVLATMWTSERTEDAPIPDLPPPALPAPSATPPEAPVAIEPAPASASPPTRWILGAGFGFATGIVQSAPTPL